MLQPADYDTMTYTAVRVTRVPVETSSARRRSTTPSTRVFRPTDHRGLLAWSGVMVPGGHGVPGSPWCPLCSEVRKATSPSRHTGHLRSGAGSRGRSRLPLTGATLLLPPRHIAASLAPLTGRRVRQGLGSRALSRRPSRGRCTWHLLIALPLRRAYNLLTPRVP